MTYAEASEAIRRDLAHLGEIETIEAATHTGVPCWKVTIVTTRKHRLPERTTYFFETRTPRRNSNGQSKSTP
jgi:hypothetical protein